MKKSNRVATSINKKKVKRNNLPAKSFIWLVIFVLIGFSSCKTTRIVTAPVAIVKPMSANKLIRNIENNAFDYKHFSVKKISCQFDNGKTRTSFRANIQAEKDKQIILNLTKLNIPVGRLWLTPDSVKFINYLENNYLLDDYSYLSSMFSIDLDFETVNNIISNNVFSIRDEKRERDTPEYEVTIDSGMYVLHSVKKIKTTKNKQKLNERKSNRRNAKLIDGSPIQQLLYIDPLTYKLRKMELKDEVNSRSINIEFSGFVEVGKQLYPGEIFLHLQSPENNMQMRIELSNFSMDAVKGIRFKVPEKYTQFGYE